MLREYYVLKKCSYLLRISFPYSFIAENSDNNLISFVFFELINRKRCIVSIHVRFLKRTMRVIVTLYRKHTFHVKIGSVPRDVFRRFYYLRILIWDYSLSLFCFLLKYTIHLKAKESFWNMTTWQLTKTILLILLYSYEYFPNILLLKSRIRISTVNLSKTY
jgi:hypothetical protein